MLKEVGRQQVQTIGLIDPIGQGREADRVKTVNRERRIDVDSRPLNPLQAPHFLHQTPPHPPHQLLRRSPGNPGGRAGHRRRRRRRKELPAQFPPLPPGHQDVAPITRQNPIKGLQSDPALQRNHPQTSPQRTRRLLIHPQAPLPPQGPTDRHGLPPPPPLAHPLIAQRRKTVEKGVRPRIVRLPRITHRPAQRREKNHEVQINPGGGGVQGQRPIHLRRQHRRRRRRRLIAKIGVAHQRGAMNHPAEPPMKLQYRLRRRRHRPRVPQITPQILNLAGPPGQGGRPSAPGRTAAQNHLDPGSGETAGQQPPQTPQTAGEPNHAALAQARRRGRGQCNLPQPQDLPPPARRQAQVHLSGPRGHLGTHKGQNAPRTLNLPAPITHDTPPNPGMLDPNGLQNPRTARRQRLAGALGRQHNETAKPLLPDTRLHRLKKTQQGPRRDRRQQPHRRPRPLLPDRLPQRPILLQQEKMPGAPRLAAPGGKRDAPPLRHGANELRLPLGPPFPLQQQEPAQGKQRRTALIQQVDVEGPRPGPAPPARRPGPGVGIHLRRQRPIDPQLIQTERDRQGRARIRRQHLQHAGQQRPVEEARPPVRGRLPRPDQCRQRLALMIVEPLNRQQPAPMQRAQKPVAIGAPLLAEAAGPDLRKLPLPRLRPPPPIQHKPPLHVNLAPGSKLETGAARILGDIRPHRQTLRPRPQRPHPHHLGQADHGIGAPPRTRLPGHFQGNAGRQHPPVIGEKEFIPPKLRLKRPPGRGRDLAQQPSRIRLWARLPAPRRQPPKTDPDLAPLIAKVKVQPVRRRIRPRPLRGRPEPYPRRRPASPEDAQLTQGKRDRRRQPAGVDHTTRSLGAGLQGQTDGRLQRRIGKARMHHESLGIPPRRRRQGELRHHLLLPRVKDPQPPVGGPVFDARRTKGPIGLLPRQRPQRQGPPPPGEIKPRRTPQGPPEDLAPAENRRPARRPPQDLKRNGLPPLPRMQLYADIRRPRPRPQRPQPHHLPQADPLPRALLTLLNGRPRHFQIRHRRQDALPPQTVVPQKEFLAAEAGGKPLHPEARRIAVHQGMQPGGRGRPARRRPRQPIALPRKGIGRQRNPGRRRRPKELRPGQIIPLAIERPQPQERLAIGLRLRAQGPSPPQQLRRHRPQRPANPAPRDLPGEQFGRRSAPPAPLEQGRRLPAAPHHHRQTARKMMAPLQEGVGDLLELRLIERPPPQIRRQVRPAPAQRLGRLGRKRQQLKGRRPSRGPPRRRKLLHHHMGVGAAHPEGAHPPGADPARLRRPRPIRLVDEKRTAIPINIAALLLAVQARGNGLGLQGLHQADEADPPRGGKGVPQVGLHRRQRTAPAPGRPTAEDLDQGVDLHRIPQPRPRAVRHNVIHLRGIQPRLLIHPPDQRRLRHPARRRDPIGLPIIVDARADNHRPNRVPRRHRLGQGPQHHHGHRLPGHHPLRPPVEGKALPLARKHPRPRQADIQLRRQHQVHPRRHRRIALARPQTQAGLMHRHQARGTGRINRQGRPLEIQKIGQPRGQNSAVVRRHILIPRQPLIGPLLHPHKTADPPPRQLPGAPSGVLQRLPGFLQQMALPRVHPLGLARRNLEKQRIKLRNPGDKTAPLAVGLAGLNPRAPIPLPPIKALPGNLRDGVPPPLQEPPQRIRIPRLRKAAAQPNDRDRPPRRRALRAGLRAALGAPAPGPRPPRRRRRRRFPIPPFHNLGKLGAEIRRQTPDRRVPKKDGGRNPNAKTGRQAPGKLGEIDRVKTKIGQIHIRLQLIPREPQEPGRHLRHLPANALLNAQTRQPQRAGGRLPALRPPRRIRLRPPRRVKETAQAGGRPHQHQLLSVGLADHPVQQPQGILGLQQPLPARLKIKRRPLLPPQIHAALPPKRPVDDKGTPRALPLRPQSVPIAGISRLKAVGNRIITRPKITQAGRARGKITDKIQGLIRQHLIQDHSAPHLRSQHLAEGGAVLGQDARGPLHAGGVNEAVKRPKAPPRRPQGPPQRPLVGHIRRQIQGPPAQGRQFTHQRLLAGVQGRAAKQDQSGPVPLSQTPRHQTPHAPAPAGQDIGPARTPRRRQGPQLGRPNPPHPRRPPLKMHALQHRPAQGPPQRRRPLTVEFPRRPARHRQPDPRQDLPDRPLKTPPRLHPAALKPALNIRPNQDAADARPPAGQRLDQRRQTIRPLKETRLRQRPQQEHRFQSAIAPGQLRQQLPQRLLIIKTHPVAIVRRLGEGLPRHQADDLRIRRLRPHGLHQPPPPAQIIEHAHHRADPRQAPGRLLPDLRALGKGHHPRLLLLSNLRDRRPPRQLPEAETNPPLQVRQVQIQPPPGPPAHHPKRLRTPPKELHRSQRPRPPGRAPQGLLRQAEGPPQPRGLNHQRLGRFRPAGDLAAKHQLGPRPPQLQGARAPSRRRPHPQPPPQGLQIQPRRLWTITDHRPPGGVNELLPRPRFGIDLKTHAPSLQGLQPHVKPNRTPARPRRPPRRRLFPNNFAHLNHRPLRPPRHGRPRHLQQPERIGPPKTFRALAQDPLPAAEGSAEAPPGQGRGVRLHQRMQERPRRLKKPPPRPRPPEALPRKRVGGQMHPPSRGRRVQRTPIDGPPAAPKPRHLGQLPPGHPPGNQLAGVFLTLHPRRLPLIAPAIKGQGAPAGKGVQPLPKLNQVPDQENDPPAPSRTPGLQRQRNILQAAPRRAPLPEKRRKPNGRSSQRLPSLGRERNQVRPSLRPPPPALRRLILPNHEMHIRAAVPKAVQGRQPEPPARALPPGPLRADHKGRAAELHQGIEPAKGGQARQVAMPQTQQDLDQPHHARTGARMPDMRLGAAHHAIPPPLRESAKRPHQGIGLHRIPQLRSRPVGLQIGNGLGIDPMAAVDLRHQGLLGRPAGRGDAIARPILVQTRGADHPVDRIPRRLGVGQPLQDHYPHPLGQHGPIRPGVEGPDHPRGREHLGLRQTHQTLPPQRRINAARQGHLRLAAAQALTSLVQGHPGGRTARVHHHRRPLEIQKIGKPRGDERIRCPGKGLMKITARLGAHKNPHPRPRQGLRIPSRILQGPPALLQHQALMRIHRLGLGRGKMKKTRIKTIPALQHPAPLAIGLAGLFPRVKVAPLIQITLRQLPHARLSRNQIAPEGPRIRRPGKLAGHPHNRDFHRPKTRPRRRNRPPRRRRAPPRRRPARRNRRPPGAGLRNMPRQGRRARILKEERSIHRAAQRLIEPLHQGRPQQGVDPVIRKRRLPVDLRRRHPKDLSKRADHHRQGRFPRRLPQRGRRRPAPGPKRLRISPRNMGRQALGRGILKEDRSIHLQPQPGVHVIDQGHPEQGIHPVVREGQVRPQLRDRDLEPLRQALKDHPDRRRLRLSP
ncbi:MAG: hypothetical protein M2R45_01124 [Verrucomicrobia subdivision 3 bacterium]|nr:hypothetical protein [Limisphaerales bacterium]